MLEKSVNATTLLLSGLAFIILGFFMIYANNVTLKLLLLLLGVVTIIYGGILIFKALYNKRKNSKHDRIFDTLIGIRDFVIGGLILTFSDFILHSLAVCFGIYLLLHTIVNIIEYFIYRKYKIKGRLKIILNIFFLLFFLLPLLFNLKQNIKVTSIIVGIYFVGYGITHITDFLTVIIPNRRTDKIKKQIQIPLPTILNAFIPKKLITLVNEMLEVTHDVKDFNYQKENITPDIYVLIHLSNFGTAVMGHMELSYEDKIYSYGNYDMHSRSLFETIGDGVILVANKNKYIEYMINKKDRYIIEFGIALTEKEKQIVKEQLDKLVYSNTEPYYSDYQRALKHELEMKEYKDMSSELFQYAEGKFYKIVKGKYKKFFVLKTNCAMVVQFVLSSIGKQILCINGIITPGAYYDYLNDRFKLKNTNVISRKVYLKEKQD